MDSALTRALRRPVGEWTAEWQQRIVPGMRLGPTLPLKPLLTGLVTLLVAPVLALWPGRTEAGRMTWRRVLLLFLLALPGTYGRAGRSWQRQVQASLARSDQMMRARGYTRITGEYAGGGRSPGSRAGSRRGRRERA